MNKDEYQIAITNLMSDKINYREIVISLAREYPGIFNQLVANKSAAPGWLREYAALALSSKKIEAIKLMRVNTEMSLRDAMDFLYNVHAYLKDLGLRKYALGDTTDFAPVHAKWVDLFEQVKYIYRNFSTFNS